MLYSERHRPRCVGLAGAVHRTWAVAEKNDWQFSNPRIDTALTAQHMERTVEEERELTGLTHHELSWLTQDRTSWRRFINVLCFSRSEEDQVSKK